MFKLLFSFYKKHFFIHFIVSLLCVNLLHEIGISMIFYVVIYKVLVYSVHIVTSVKSNNQYYIYYKNLGLSKLNLWLGFISIDFVILSILSILT